MRHRRRTVLSRRVFRRLWVVGLCLGIAGVISAQASSARTVTWSSSTTLLVPTLIGHAYDAQQQATTYAALIPLDDGIATAVARQTGMSPNEVRGGLTVTNVQNTSLIVITFHAATPQLAARGVRAFSAAVSGPSPVSEAIQPNSLTVFNAPSPPGRSTSGGPILPIGIMLGAIAGIAAAVILDRVDLRADDTETVERVVNAPVTDVREASRESLAALAERWRDLAGNTGNVALIAVDRAAVPAASAAARAIVAATALAGPSGPIGFRVAIGRPTSDRDVEHVVGRYHTPGMDDRTTLVLVPAEGTWRDDGELTAVGADAVVLVVREGQRLQDAEDAARRLSMLGRPPSWCLVVPGSSRRFGYMPTDDVLMREPRAEERSRAT